MYTPWKMVLRAKYSTGVSRDFLEQLLASAKEAAAMKKSQRPARNNAKYSKQKQQQQHQRQTRLSTGPPMRERGPAGAFHPMTAPGATASQVKPADQPQFKAKRSKGAPLAQQDEILDVFDVAETATGGARIKRTKRTARNQRNSVRNKRTGQQARTGTTTLYHARAPAKVQDTRLELEPLTRESLLRHATQLTSSPRARMLNLAMHTLRDSNFPVNRPPNEVRNSGVFTLQTPMFGKYVGAPSRGAILERERLLSNIDVKMNQLALDEKVKGVYPLLDSHKEQDFKKVAPTSAKTQRDLALNSAIVRRSLLGNASLNMDTKKLLYQVCSGLKPINELF
ncbi:mitochondrial 37S ribosomal protein mS46 RSM28 KNAG_0K02190 [Huiozyma naganishii CBS 8797]|uniref:Uncharacterized protein n=1 Tax=Huiozyma naganishii (strain ATCC MYA-139 / BCRC 22969 / CBS 8797 / KCTC 17520 / NBRC 10181 / NCYC 3082 / Yp74L-3) TaxID=1071383 RepID=J7S3F6_HUIN7|nr:hypothetical protein KNAG_0K02190 [Kazachstania naganishii CBS 8797]CCK72582.1 hypothetical protein KNAG_0K02190 [Kazachstania naganishii CBS 8797]